MIPTCNQRCTVSIDEVYFESLARPSVAQLAIAFDLLFAGLPRCCRHTDKVYCMHSCPARGLCCSSIRLHAWTSQCSMISDTACAGLCCLLRGGGGGRSPTTDGGAAAAGAVVPVLLLHAGEDAARQHCSQPWPVQPSSWPVARGPSCPHIRQELTKPYAGVSCAGRC